ncbi:MAG: hypothetical protein NTW87_21605 [Planctomycetota bacterium]|nr:hypothetical protein [Planctomycetota bacterium]
MVIHYCEKCGTLIHGTERENTPFLCADCQAGKVRTSKYLRDSDMIPNRLRFRRLFVKEFAPGEARG